MVRSSLVGFFLATVLFGTCARVIYARAAPAAKPFIEGSFDRSRRYVQTGTAKPSIDESLDRSRRDDGTHISTRKLEIIDYKDYAKGESSKGKTIHKTIADDGPKQRFLGLGGSATGNAVGTASGQAGGSFGIPGLFKINAGVSGKAEGAAAGSIAGNAYLGRGPFPQQLIQQPPYGQPMPLPPMPQQQQIKPQQQQPPPQQ